MRSDLPERHEVKIDEIAALNPDSVKSLDPGSLIRYIDISSVDNSYRIDPTISEIRLESAPSRAKRLVQTGDILVSNVRTERRSFAVIPNEFDGQVASTGFTVLRALPDIDPGYLWAVMRDPRFVEYAVRRQRGSNYPAINTSDIAEYQVLLPALPEQHRIAWILSILDNKIKLNRRIAQTLEGVAEALFKAQFVDFIGVEKFDDTELGPIPKGWSAGVVADLCARTGNGGTPKRMEPEFWKDGGVPWFKTGELNDGILPARSVEEISPAGLAASSCQLFPAGSLLVAIYASPTVGRLGILTEEAAFNQACTGLQPREPVGSAFLFFTLKRLQRYFNEIASGSAQQNISKNLVEQAPCVVPTDGALTEAVEQMEKLFDLINSAGREIHHLAAIRDELLPKLISGKIRVPEGVGPDADAVEVLGELAAESAQDEIKPPESALAQTG